MKLLTKTIITGITGLTMALSVVYAGPKPDEIDRLSNDLTPVGALRAGNEAGTIPAWTGGITEPPAGYQPGDHHPDPFPGDEVLFTI
jgi:Protein of unknown function (DUF1329).